MNRHEIKYPADSFVQIQQSLARLKMIPAHAERMVHSIYFDSLSLRFYHESNEGIVPRKKIRLRWYNNENVFCKGALETKQSKPHFRNKIVSPYAFSQKQKAHTLCSMVDDISLKPMLQVSYRRKYYINAKGVRATWDEKISYQRVLPNMQPYGAPYKDPLGVFEIKADARIPQDSLMQNIQLDRERFSKYCRGIEHTSLFLGF